MVGELSYFVDVDFRMEAPGHSKSPPPRIATHVRLSKGGEVISPLKNHSDLVTFTLEGVSGRAHPERVDFDLPSYDDDDTY